MLIKRVVLDAIVAGDIDLIFRRWKKPTVRTGGTLRTSVGMLDIVSVEQIARSSVTSTDAGRAGYRSKAALVRELSERDGDLYRIEVRPGGDDPLIELRQRTSFGPGELGELRATLAGYDSRARSGPWTFTYLELLANNPQVRAEDLAHGLGLEKKPFKANVRKLKALGLTVSFSPGYELSPRGQAYLDLIAAD